LQIKEVALPGLIILAAPVRGFRFAPPPAILDPPLKAKNEKYAALGEMQASYGPANPILLSGRDNPLIRRYS
jgi:hypothetical protein